MLRIALVMMALGLAVDAPRARAESTQFSGFTVYRAGELRGRVTTVEGKPLVGIEVFAAPPSGPTISVRTGSDGSFRMKLTPSTEATLVYVRQRARIGGLVGQATIHEGQEAIEMHEFVPPVTMPRPTEPHRIPSYSERAKETGVWTRAWVLLEIDEHGTVQRLKWLHKPGHDLEASALAAAFRLRFEPARDAADRPLATAVLWTLEWPSYWWMGRHGYAMGLLPRRVITVPCRGTGGVAEFYRDCTRPDLARAAAEPWIQRPVDQRR